MSTTVKSYRVVASTKNSFMAWNADEEHMEHEKNYLTKRLNELLSRIGSITKIVTKANCWTYVIHYNSGIIDSTFRENLKQEFPHVKITTVNGADEVSLFSHLASKCLISKKVISNSELFEDSKFNNIFNYTVKLVLLMALCFFTLQLQLFIKPNKYNMYK